MRFLPFERILLPSWPAMSFRHARQPRPMVPVRSCINRVLQGDKSSGLEILFQDLHLLLTLWILHKWRTEKGNELWWQLSAVRASSPSCMLWGCVEPSIDFEPTNHMTLKTMRPLFTTGGVPAGTPGRKTGWKSEMSYISTPRRPCVKH